MKYIHFLLDETGSMETMKTEAINGFNGYLDKIAGLENVSFTLSRFDSDRFITKTWNNVKDVAPLNSDIYQPGAVTPLYDAIARTIRITEEMVGRKHNQNSKSYKSHSNQWNVDDPICISGEQQDVLVIILTDGQENASKSYDLPRVKQLVKEKESSGWIFLFLAVDPTAFKEDRIFAGTRSFKYTAYSTGGAGLAASYGAAATNTQDWYKGKLGGNDGDISDRGSSN